MSSEFLTAPIDCPTDWQLAKLKDICTKIGSGATPTGGQGAYLEQRNKYALIRSQNVFDREFSELGLAFISDEQADRLKSAKLEKNDILLNITGDGVTFGRACIVPEKTLPACVNQHVSIVRLNPQLAHPGYVLSYLTHPLIKSYIESFNAGGSRRAITKGHIESFVIPIPPMSVQCAIAEILSVIDDRINLLLETNLTLEAIAQAMFKSWFVDFDPVHAKQQGQVPEGMDKTTSALFPDSFEESAQGLVPRGWQYSPVGAVVEGIYDGPHATPPEARDGPIFLGIKNLTGTGLNLGEIRHISEIDYAKWTRRVVPQKGDIVFSYEATLGFFAIIPESVRCCLGRRLALIRPLKTNGHGNFWFHQLVAPVFQRLLEKHTIQGATVNRIALKEFPSYLVLDPPITVKSAFQSVAEPLWRMIHINQEKARTLGSIRDTLLPRLISGRLCIGDMEGAFGEAIA